MEDKRKHLELVQGVINRMAGNSFMLKGWAVTLVAGIFALAGKDIEKLYRPYGIYVTSSKVFYKESAYH